MNNNEFVEKKSKKGLIIFCIITLLIVGIGTYFLITKVFNKIETPPTEVEVEKEKITPLMYEITKEGSTNKIYLIGSIHFANIPKLEFPNYVLDAYKNSNYLACEFNINKFLREVDQNELIKDYYYSNGDSLENHVSKESYEKIVKYLEDNLKLTKEQINVLSLSYIESLITQLLLSKSDIGSEAGVDVYFLDKAEKDNKIILEVESYEFQDNLDKSFPDRVKELSIIDAIDNPDEGIEDLNNLYKYWKTGNLTELEKLLIDSDTEGYSKEDIELMKEYDKKMLEDRNVGMKNKLEEYFNNNYTVFYMVGAAHLIGDKGIAKLVELDGYTVTRVQ